MREWKLQILREESEREAALRAAIARIEPLAEWLTLTLHGAGGPVRFSGGKRSRQRR